MATTAPLVEIGAVLLGLAVLGRLAAATGIPLLPLPLLAGLALSVVGPLERALGPSPGLVEVGTPVAVALLLFAVGLDHGPRDRVAAVSGGPRTGLLDLALNAVPGALAGLLLGTGLRGAVVLGGVTWASSWAVSTDVLSRRGWTGNRETPAVLSALVLEHLGLAVYLPLAAALLTPGGGSRVAASVLAAAVALFAAAWLVHAGGHARSAGRRAPTLRRLVFPAMAADRPQALLLGLAGVAVITAGLAEAVGVPAAGAAFLAGTVLAGAEAERARPAIDALRELSATGAFLLVGYSVGAGGALPGAVPGAVALGALATAAKLLTGRWAAAQLGAGPAGRRRAGLTLVARGEISVALAGLALSAGLERVAATAVVCVLVTGAAAAAGLTGLRPPPASRRQPPLRSDSPEVRTGA